MTSQNESQHHLCSICPTDSGKVDLGQFLDRMETLLTHMYEMTGRPQSQRGS